MQLLSPNFAVSHVANAKALKNTVMRDRQLNVLNYQAFSAAKQEIMTWPGYAVTPLHSFDRLAQQCDLKGIWYKDEGSRFKLDSFKALGGAYAVLRVIKKELRKRGVEEEVSAADLIEGRYSELTSQIEVTCATDGNHGRSVAWGAQTFGCSCVIYIHGTVSEGRKQAIENYAAQVVRVPGNYDDAVRQAAVDAEQHKRCVVSDTSYPGYMDVPRDVMQGYTVMVDEALEQLPFDEAPSHIFIQGGVGGLAAAVLAQAWETYGKQRPRFIVVEPENAACLYESAKNGEPTVVHGELDTIMAGLACGEVSLLAWEILEEGADDFLTIPDESAAECMRMLARGDANGKSVVAGESAVAGLAGLLLAAKDPELRRKLQLTPESRVLLIGSEGATDADLYKAIVGKSAEEVRGYT